MNLPEHFSRFFRICNVEQRDNGLTYVHVDSVVAISASERGKLLLDLEDEMCKEDSGIRVWHASIGDKNSLRKLRGIDLS
jgi:hypothetical protein